MTQQTNFNELHPAVETIFKNGFDGMAESMRLIFNEAKKMKDNCYCL